MITSTRNPKVAAAMRLHKRAFRERDGAFLVEGAHAVGEALDGQRGLLRLFHTDPSNGLVARARAAGVDLVHVAETVMGKLTGTVTPQGLVGVSAFVDVGLDALPEQPGCVAVLHAVRDPGNAGTVLRSADAAGADAVVFSPASVDVYNAKTVRASAGSLFHLPVVRDAETVDAVEALRARGMRVLAMDARGEADLFEQDLSDPVAFVFGNEAWGLPEDVARRADGTVRVPIAGRSESLNLAAAATVCLFERRRRVSGDGGSTLATIVAAAAHDLRSPLTAMKGIAHTLARRWHDLSEADRDLLLGGLEFDADRLNAIVRQLVDAGRLAGGPLDLFPERVDVADVVRQVTASLARDPEHAAVAWSGGELLVFVDPDRLRLVLEAFVESLVWWAGEGGIEVTGGLEGADLRVEACRPHPRVSQSEAAGLFEPRPPGTGSGSKIGLHVALGIAKAQGGTVSARVETDSLCFVLELPNAAPPA